MADSRERVVLERLRFDDGTFGPWRTPASDMDPVVKAFYEVQTFVPEGTQEEGEGLVTVQFSSTDEARAVEEVADGQADEIERIVGRESRWSNRAAALRAGAARIRQALSTQSEVGEAGTGPSGSCPACGSDDPLVGRLLLNHDTPFGTPVEDAGTFECKNPWHTTGHYRAECGDPDCPFHRSREKT